MRGKSGSGRNRDGGERGVERQVRVGREGKIPGERGKEEDEKNVNGIEGQ